ncbi:helix-turn-helix transcriptional regulator [Mycobacteroides abscessus]|uniref:helix-turn-helix transcriptional regulator n=1 Tax=Mycobacteroides abscessus TaxID=36809 RepID=UPI0018E4600D|nr:helix-turn-helix domain-containing protein [Mycobacteroides abscessus]
MSTKREPRLSDLITAVEFADMAGVTPATVETWRWRDYGPAFYRIGRYVVYSRPEVERWIAEVYHVGLESRAGRKPKTKGGK